MVTVKQGDTFKADGFKSGSGSKGTWFLLPVKADKDKISIWNHDGFTCSAEDTVKIVSIKSVTKKKRQYQEKWYDETDVICDLEVVGRTVEKSPFSEFQDLQDDDGDLPF